MQWLGNEKAEAHYLRSARCDLIAIYVARIINTSVCSDEFIKRARGVMHRPLAYHDKSAPPRTTWRAHAIFLIHFQCKTHSTHPHSSHSDVFFKLCVTEHNIFQIAPEQKAERKKWKTHLAARESAR